VHVVVEALGARVASERPSSVSMSARIMNASDEVILLPGWGASATTTKRPRDRASAPECPTRETAPVRLVVRIACIPVPPARPARREARDVELGRMRRHPSKTKSVDRHGRNRRGVGEGSAVRVGERRKPGCERLESEQYRCKAVERLGLRSGERTLRERANARVEALGLLENAHASRPRSAQLRARRSRRAAPGQWSGRRQNDDFAPPPPDETTYPASSSAAARGSPLLAGAEVDADHEPRAAHGGDARNAFEPAVIAAIRRVPSSRSAHEPLARQRIERRNRRGTGERRTGKLEVCTTSGSRRQACMARRSDARADR